MNRRMGRGSSRSLSIAAGVAVALGIGGLSLAIASSEGGEDGARVEQARGDEARELGESRRAAEAAHVEIERLDRVRANQFQELVALRREAASLRQDLEAAVTARAQVDAAEIARLNRVRQNLFEDLVGTRRELAAAQARLESAVSAPRDAEPGQQTGSLAREPLPTSVLRVKPHTSAGTSVQRAPVPAMTSRPPARLSSVAKAPSQREKIAPGKPIETVRTELRRTPQALPSALMLHGAAR
jgi:hypothetical protein